MRIMRWLIFHAFIFVIHRTFYIGNDGSSLLEENIKFYQLLTEDESCLTEIDISIKHWINYNNAAQERHWAERERDLLLLKIIIKIIFRCSLTTRESLITDYDWETDWWEVVVTGWSQLNELVDLILVEHWSREEAEHGVQHTGSIIIVPHTTTSMLVISWYFFIYVICALLQWRSW